MQIPGPSAIRCSGRSRSAAAIAWTASLGAPHSAALAAPPGVCLPDPCLADLDGPAGVPDGDSDGVGDTAYELYVYADRLWQDVPYAQFFKGSPVLEVLDFLERLAPFTEPHLLVSDARPSRTREFTLVKEKQQVRDSLDLLRQSLGR